MNWTTFGAQAIAKLSVSSGLQPFATIWNLGLASERTYLVGVDRILVHNKTMGDDLCRGGDPPNAQRIATGAAVDAKYSSLPDPWNMGPNKNAVLWPYGSAYRQQAVLLEPPQ